MTDAVPSVGRLYTRLASLLVLGLAVGAFLMFTVEPGSGSISVAGAILAVGLAAVLLVLATLGMLRFMGQMSTALRAEGAQGSSWYGRLIAFLAAAVVVAAIVLFATDLGTGAWNVGGVLFGAVAAIVALAVVLLLLLVFLRSLAVHVPDGPRLGSLYLGMATLVVVAVAVGAIVLAAVEPGAGSLSLGSGLLADGVLLLALAVTVLALLLHLRGLAEEAQAVTVEEPARKGPVKVAATHIAHPMTGAELVDTSTGNGTKTGAKPAEAPVKGRDVLDIEGIGPTYQKRLKAHGIHVVEQLAAADAATIAKAAETTTEQATLWKTMAGLMAVKGIGPQYAEILTMAGITGPKDLAAADAAALLAKIDAIEDRRQKSRVLKVNVELGRVKALITAAQQHD